MQCQSVGPSDQPPYLPNAVDCDVPCDETPHRREGRVATGRRHDILCAMIEGLPKLLVEAVKTAVDKCITDAVAEKIHKSQLRGSDSKSDSKSPVKQSSEGSHSDVKQHLSVKDWLKLRDEDVLQNISRPSSAGPRGSRDNSIVPAPNAPIGREHTPRTFKRVQQLQTLYVEEVTSNLGLNDLCPRRCVSPLNFRVWGILPWSERAGLRRFHISWCYSWLVVLLAGLALVASIATYYARRTFLYPTQMFITFGALVVVLQSRRLSFQRVLGSHSAILCRYATAKAFHFQWDTLTKFQYIPTTSLQCAIALASCAPFLMRGQGDILDYVLHALQQAAFAFCCCLVVTASSFLWHISCALQLGVDAFGDTFDGAPDFKKAVENWGELRAVTRVVCAAVSPVFGAVTFAVICGLLSFAATILVVGEGITGEDLWEVVGTGLPVGLTAVSVMLSLLKAAAVTESCMLVPEMVNCYSFGEELDEDRSYLADYMTRSNSGFYLMGVRLTMSAVLKLSNSVTLVAATLLARVLAQASKFQ